ncbi:MAG: FixH family protein [Ideonella sp.]|nr:FixH family protein [Ideonella sp.]
MSLCLVERARRRALGLGLGLGLMALGYGPGAWAKSLDSVPLSAEAAKAFAEGRAALAQAQREQQLSRQAILEAGRVRQALVAAQTARGASPAAAQDREGLGRRLEALQQQGAQARASAEQALGLALQRFTDGMAIGWAPWVRNREPLTLDDGLRQLMAHNTRMRSVHPNMPTPTAGELTPVPTDELSLRFPILASQNPPQDLDIGAFQLSRDQRYVAHIEVHPAPGAPAGNVAAVPLNRLHRWRLLVSDLNGQPVSGAKIAVTGHMPGHVHGLPTQPRVTQALAPGVYLVEGLKFQMEGWWVMQFDIQGADSPQDMADNVAFNLVFE